ncbi:MAG TPA: TonB-dependent receptor, partial [Bacteroidia bacterium]|nr:TonB-dependent receptor [Bacteroidia bacterium]
MKKIKIYALFCCVIIKTGICFGQTGNLKGNVKDSTGRAIPNAIILIENTNYITQSNEEGKYKFDNLPIGKYTLLGSLTGCQPISKNITISANNTYELNFILIGKINFLNEVVINGVHTISGMGHLAEVHDGVIYSGKKNEVLILDSLNANTAEDNPRQVLGRVPGSNYSETEGGGFPSNGIGFRGLNPTQSIETNTREDGYNITGDIFGYPESYYLPPLEAVERIEITRGASALEFGPQFGGVVNYIVKSGPSDKPFEFTTSQTAGSYGLMNSFNSIGGTYKKWDYYAFVEGKYSSGWRPNSDYQQVTGFGRLEYQANKKFKIGLEYSLLRNKLHMPGGLDDVEFNQNPDQSFRTRNWLTTPWNILALTAEYKLSNQSELYFQSAENFSSRSIVWRNEDGGPESMDTINPVTLTFQPREIIHEYFKNSTNELRSVSFYKMGKQTNVIDAGARLFYGWMKRQSGGVGTTNSNFDFRDSANYYSKNISFTTLNVASYIENIFHFGNRLSITPGFRFEYIKSSAIGYVTDDDDSIINVNESKPRYIPLAGLGIQFKTTATTNIYANISQAYTPIEYSFLYPLGLDTNARIDHNLKDAYGYNADFGWRGSFKNIFNFDIGGFYMAYNNAIGFEDLKDANGNTYSYETNVADAAHYGAETYVELNITKLFSQHSKIGNISFFNSFAYDNATYINGMYKGN